MSKKLTVTVSPPPQPLQRSPCGSVREMSVATPPS
jgi:hypothetical protein